MEVHCVDYPDIYWVPITVGSSDYSDGYSEYLDLSIGYSFGPIGVSWTPDFGTEDSGINIEGADASHNFGTVASGVSNETEEVEGGIELQAAVDDDFTGNAWFNASVEATFEYVDVGVGPSPGDSTYSLEASDYFAVEYE